MRFFLGADVGSTKTHALIADETGKAIGFGKGGPGNHETVGYGGFQASLQAAAGEALKSAGLESDAIAGAGFGIAGYDWPSETEKTLEVIYSLGLCVPVRAVNDAILGILAGSAEGWGVAVVSGTGCNAWGWDASRQHIAQMTGGGTYMGEGAGGTELVEKAVQAVARQWTGRGPATRLTPMFIEYAGARDPVDLIDGLMNGRYTLNAAAAPVVFQAASGGDEAALETVRWAGRELGELAVAVIRRLHFERLAFDVVQVGSLYEGSPLLTETMRQTIQAIAPRARVVRLTVPAVIGAVLLGMETAGIAPTAEIRSALNSSAKGVIGGK